MKFLIAALAVTAAIAGPAAAQSAAEKTGINSVMGVAPSTEDFVQQASASDMFEIESSKLALQKGNDKTKGFAQQMIDDHEKTSLEMKQMIESGKVKATPSTTLASSQADMVEGLKELNGAEFDEQYIDDQVTAHENAVDLFKRYSEGGDHGELKTWAASTLPALQHHLEMVKGMQK